MRRDVFNAIADPTRRSILVSLTAESQNLSALADQFDMSRQAVSLHVKYLEECGVVSIKQQGRERFCSLELQKMAQITDWLEPFRKLWEARFNQLDTLLGGMKEIES